MLPDPLHPAVVHFPLALAALTPLFAGLGWLALARGWASRSSWAGVVALALLLVASAYLAAETGEDEEERVEEVVAEGLIHDHEEAAERLFRVAALTLIAAGVGLAPGRPGALGRAATLLLAGVALLAAIQTGRLGGELVYRHGAAAAYAEPPAQGERD